MNGNILDFERPILELERKIEELKKLAYDGSIDLKTEISTLQSRLKEVKKKTYKNLIPWQRVQIARHAKRPYTLDYIELMTNDFIELHGDRSFADDRAIIGGLAKIDNEKVLIVGHQKGRNTKENIICNFGSPHPEGYRKAIRLMKLAEKFFIPIVVFIDTPGAYPGIGAEERGQANAIAYNLRSMTLIEVPIVILVIGEGGSGGALGIGVGDRICVLENAYYSVISPEGCAAILWKDSTKAPEAAEALKMTAGDLFEMGIIDEVVPEPLGGAHYDPVWMAQTVKDTIIRHLCELKTLSKEELLKNRYDKYRNIGIFED